MIFKKFMVKDHEKFVTASYPELIKRGAVVNMTGVVACYVTGVLLWKLHKRLFPAIPTQINENLTTIEND